MATIIYLATPMLVAIIMIICFWQIDKNYYLKRRAHLYTIMVLTMVGAYFIMSKAFPLFFHFIWIAEIIYLCYLIYESYKLYNMVKRYLIDIMLYCKEHYPTCWKEEYINIAKNLTDYINPKELEIYEEL